MFEMTCNLFYLCLVADFDRMKYKPLETIKQSPEELL